MNGTFWVTEQLVASRMDDMQRAAAARRVSPRRAARWAQPVATRLGLLMIRAGRRLADPEIAVATFAAPPVDGARVTIC